MSHGEKQTDRQIYRQSDTDRQTDRQTDGHRKRGYKTGVYLELDRKVVELPKTKTGRY